MTSEDKSLRVAVIGGGIGGATTAYYLRSLFKNNISIWIFEKSGRIGGRLKSIEFAGRRVESGASVFYSHNKYMFDFAKTFGLNVLNVSESQSALSIFGPDYKPLFSTIGVPSYLVNLYTVYNYYLRPRLFSRFFMTSHYFFQKIYRFQEIRNCYTSPGLIFEHLPFINFDLLRFDFPTSVYKHFKISQNRRVLNEFIHGITTHQFGHNVFQMHGLLSVFSMMSFLSSSYCIENGNEQIPQRLIENALKDNPVSNDPKTFLNAEVTRIDNVAGSSQRYSLTYYNNETMKSEQAEFDYVVIAFPLSQESKLVGPANVQLPCIEYQTVDTCFFHATLKPSMFGLQPESLKKSGYLQFMPSKDYQLVQKGGVLNSLNLLTFYLNDQWTTDNIWMTYSDAKYMANPIDTVSNTLLDLVDPDKSFKSVRWLAQPVYRPTMDPCRELVSFVLAPRLYYANAIEQIASTMEMAIIGGRNVALLVADDSINTGYADKVERDELTKALLS